jgi:thymidine phosphorylase
MAIYSGSDERRPVTEAMIATGGTVDLRSALGRKVVDKHSTGGVGDKTSIAGADRLRAASRSPR